MIINKKIFDYRLPKELIAQEPLKDRSSSKLLVLERETGAITHTRFDKITDYMSLGDCLVLNDTRVIPARLIGEKPTGAAVEVLLLRRREHAIWEALVRPAKRLKDGDCVVFGGGLLKARIVRSLDDGVRYVQMEYDGVFEQILELLGETPLPPYITKKLMDKGRYQTVYAKRPGSAAAPTAGLHFTDGLLEQIAAKGVSVAKITLHVGLGTFRPIKTDNLLEHKMHSELYSVSAGAAGAISRARRAGGKIICVGTTTVRTLETIALRGGEAVEAVEGAGGAEGETDIFIYPGFEFKLTDGLVTNFHLPESTLMALVAAFAGTESVMEAYRAAVSRKYRFFSFGDAMLII